MTSTDAEKPAVTHDRPSVAVGRAVPLVLPHRAPGRVFNLVTPLLERHVSEGRGDRLALRERDRVVSYRELQELSHRAGNALRQVGVEPEQRVAILLPDCIDFVAVFLGALAIGAVPIPLNALAPPEELAYFLEDSRARALVTTPDLLPSALADRVGPTLLKAVFVTGEPDAFAEERGVQFLAAAMAHASPELDVFPTFVDEPCYWLYSSGTTGRPKGVVHLHGDMLAVLAPYDEEVLGITPNDVVFSVSRLYFSYGLGNSLFLPLLAGASVVVDPDRPEPAHVVEIVRRYRPSLFFSVPTSYVALCAYLSQPENRLERPFASVRLALSAGEPLPEPLYRRWVDLTDVELVDGLGSTEVGAQFCANRPGQVRPGSSGRPLGDHQLRIVDDRGRDVPTGRPGELLVRSASTALNYWNQRDRTKETFLGEWLRTGDRYRRDADGFYWHLGRIKDTFKVSGQWVSPLEVESCLLEHPSVLECAIVGAPDDAGLTKLKAYIVRRPNADMTAAEIQRHVKTRLKPHNYPHWVVFVDELPKTSTGKMQRFKLRG
jgi:benzoate-CoA ligase family protein